MNQRKKKRESYFGLCSFNELMLDTESRRQKFPFFLNDYKEKEMKKNKKKKIPR